MMSDLNMLLGDLIKGNENKKIDFGGTLLKEFLENDHYTLVNNSNQVEDGPYTRYDPSDPSNEEKWSCLDLVIISTELSKYVKKLIIDKRLSFTPFYIDLNKKVTHSDHFSCLLLFENIPLKADYKKLVPPKQIKWNTNKKNGWDKYFELTTNNAKLERIVKDPNFETPEEIDKCINKEMKNVKFEAFGKVGYKIKVKTTPEL